LGRLRVPTRRCDLVVPADWGWGRSNKYESANNMADIGDKIKDYIAKMASTSITNDDVVTNMRDTKYCQ